MEAKTGKRAALLFSIVIVAALFGTFICLVVSMRVRDRNSLRAERERQAEWTQIEKRIERHLHRLEEIEARLAGETTDEELDTLRGELRDFKAKAPLSYPDAGPIAECIRGECDRLLNDDDAALGHYSHVPPYSAGYFIHRSAKLGRAKVRLNLLQDALLQHSQDPRPLCVQVLDVFKKEGEGPTTMAELWIMLANEQIDDVDAGATKEIAAGRSPAEAHYLRGLARQARGMAEEAMADFTASIDADHGKPRVWFHRGSAWFAREEFDRAVADFNRALKLKPDFVGAWVNRGVTKHSKGDFDGAISDFDQALTLDPKSVVAHCDRGIARRDKKDFAAAIEDFDAAITLEPADAGATYERARTHLAKDDRPAAIADFKRFLELAPEGPEADDARARLRELGERD